MGNYEATLIQNRLNKLAREREKVEAIINEKSDRLFEAIREFNASRNIEEKVKLAKEIKKEQEKLTSWSSRSQAAWEKRRKLDEEESELGWRLAILKFRSGKL